MFSFPVFDDKSEKKFLKACENGDVDTAKTMIDQGIMTFSGVCFMRSNMITLELLS